MNVGDLCAQPNLAQVLVKTFHFYGSEFVAPRSYVMCGVLGALGWVKVPSFCNGFWAITNCF